MLPVRIAIENSFLDSTALTDSGAALSLIYWDLISKFNIPTQPCIPPIKISTVNNKPIGDGISWLSHLGTTLFWDAHGYLFTTLSFPGIRESLLTGPHYVSFTVWTPRSSSHVSLPSIERPDTKQSATIPSCYQDFLKVFSKVMATKLPPNRSWDCRIDLLPNAMPPKIKSTHCHIQKHKPRKSTSRKL